MRASHWVPILAIVAAAVLAGSAVAQVNNHPNDTVFRGVPASVTSFNFGGQPGFHGVPASVTSPNFGVIRPVSPNPGRPVFGERHHRHRAFINPFYSGGYYVPYAYPYYGMDAGIDDSMESDYVPPAVEDRAASAAREEVRNELNSLRSEVEDYRSEIHSRARTEDAKPQNEEPPTPQPKTVLVFKDGHQVELANYAIVGSTLYDLSQGRTKKIALAELDLPATVKQNDDRGLNFQLPVTAKTN